MQELVPGEPHTLSRIFRSRSLASSLSAALPFSGPHYEINNTQRRSKDCSSTDGYQMQTLCKSRALRLLSTSAHTRSVRSGCQVPGLSGTGDAGGITHLQDSCKCAKTRRTTDDRTRASDLLPLTRLAEPEDYNFQLKSHSSRILHGSSRCPECRTYGRLSLS